MDALYTVLKEKIEWRLEEKHNVQRTTTGREIEYHEKLFDAAPIQQYANEAHGQKTSVEITKNQFIKKAGYLGNQPKAYSGDGR